MPINMSTITTVMNNTNNKEVIKIEDSLGRILWQKSAPAPSIPLFMSNGTSYQYVYEGTSWTAKTWTGLTNISGLNIWTDGTNIYHSSGKYSYVLDLTTSTWTAKTWTGLTTINGNYIWTDGTDIYHSNLGTHHVLNVATSTWTQITFTGAPKRVSGNAVWTDGTDIYIMMSSTGYIYDKATKSFTEMPSTCPVNANSVGARYIWSDGINTYYSIGSTRYIFNKATKSWVDHDTWLNGAIKPGNVNGSYTFYYNNKVYTMCSADYKQYVFDSATETWTPQSFPDQLESSNFIGQYMWTEKGRAACPSTPVTQLT